MLLLRLISLAVCLGMLAPTRAPVAPNDAAVDPSRVVRGMTISCHGSGRIWGTDATVETMADLKSLGVNWVAIHPYAGIGADGTVGGRMSGMYADPSWLTRPIAEAHRLGLKIMIKPHLAYWGSRFSWRGEIAFETDEQWTRFFKTYERWITDVAELSSDADAFVVGTELDATIHHVSEWRGIIAGVREKTGAPLTYASNWDSFERVRFWDALDVIGIQSYFPLLAEEGLPAQAELDRAWQALLARLERFAARHDRKVVLAELGYNISSRAAVEPWDHRTGGPEAEEIQRRCMQAALKTLATSDTVVGAFLWKWFPGERRRRGNFLMSTPAMREVIRTHWHPGASHHSPEAPE